MANPFDLPPGVERHTTKQDRLAFGETPDGTRRLVRIETVAHVEQVLTVVPSVELGEVALRQRYVNNRLRAMDDYVSIRMAPDEARRIGELLIAAADEAALPAGPQVPAAAGSTPNTASMTSATAGSAISRVSESGSISAVRPSAASFSAARLIASRFVRRSASVGSLLNSALSKVFKIASTATCLPNARATVSKSDIPSSIVSRKLDGSGPGEAVERHALRLARACVFLVRALRTASASIGRRASPDRRAHGGRFLPRLGRGLRVPAPSGGA